MVIDHPGAIPRYFKLHALQHIFMPWWRPQVIFKKAGNGAENVFTAIVETVQQIPNRVVIYPPTDSKTGRVDRACQTV